MRVSRERGLTWRAGIVNDDNNILLDYVISVPASICSFRNVFLYASSSGFRCGKNNLITLSSWSAVVWEEKQNKTVMGNVCCDAIYRLKQGA